MEGRMPMERVRHDLGRLVSVQYLRAMAALLVMFAHVHQQMPAYTHYVGLAQANAGVDIFFVISGLVMSITARTGRTGAFLARRLIRIAPLYWFFTLLLVALLFAIPTQFKSTVFSPAVLLQSLLFIPHDSLGHPGEAWPLLVPGWTLNFELFFYLVFALLIGLSLGYRIVAMGLLFMVAVAGGQLLDRSAHPLLRTYTDPLLFEFLFGMIIGYFAIARPAFSALWASLLVAAGLVLLFVPVLPEIRAISYGLPAILLVCGAVDLDRLGLVPRLRLWNFLGDASYSIYLSHIFSFGLWRALWTKAGCHDDPICAALFTTTALIFAALSGGLVYIGLERPLLERLRALLRRHGQRCDHERSRIRLLARQPRPGPAREPVS
jgi:exopolysaccharide production protein ExoZ